MERPLGLLKFVLLILSISFTTVAEAQVSKGDKQVQFISSVFSQPGTEYQFVNAIFNLRASTYLTNNLELGVGTLVRLTGYEVPFQGGGTGYELDTGIGLGGFLSYSFLSEDAKLMPYVGAQVFSNDLTGDTVPFFAGGNVGIRYFITEMVNLDAGLNAGAPINGEMHGALIMIQFGLGILFPSDF